MTLRDALGGDARLVHELVDQLLDSEDGLIAIVDSRRAISYAVGFGLSPCQLELVTLDIERVVRAAGGAARTKSRPGRIRREDADRGGRGLDRAA